MLGKKIVSVLLLLVTAAVAETIPSGAKLTVRLDSTINSQTAKTGQTFHGTLARSLVVSRKNIADAGAWAGPARLVLERDAICARATSGVSQKYGA